MFNFERTLDPKPLQVRRLEVLTGVGGRRPRTLSGGGRPGGPLNGIPLRCSP